MILQEDSKRPGEITSRRAFYLILYFNLVYYFFTSIKIKIVYTVSIMAKRATSVGKGKASRSKKTAKRLAVKHAKIAARTTTKRR